MQLCIKTINQFFFNHFTEVFGNAKYVSPDSIAVLTRTVDGTIKVPENGQAFTLEVSFFLQSAIYFYCFSIDFCFM